MNMDERESTLAALVENIQRQDLDYIEEARAISQLLSQWGMSQEQAAKCIGKSQSAVANKLRLLRHSQPVLNALRAGESHGAPRQSASEIARRGGQAVGHRRDRPAEHERGPGGKVY